MGWVAVPSDDGRRIFGHSGSVLTFSADMVLLLDDGIAFALLYNVPYTTICSQIRDGVIALLRGSKPAQSSG